VVVIAGDDGCVQSTKHRFKITEFTCSRHANRLGYVGTLIKAAGIVGDYIQHHPMLD
jgi:hypothetical protein